MKHWRGPERPRMDPLRILGGAALALAGALLMALLFYVANSHSPFAERMLFVIGLADSLLLSAFAQTLVLVGLWLAGTGWRRQRSPYAGAPELSRHRTRAGLRRLSR